ncbi:hypothetical protein [Paenisporosarcina quisquiliarum]|uniref:hypothetical protein n=1 Tax=Paenisporosarcina quisquiliarum TaxID=365346 RepID=UPI003735147D
MDSEGYDKLGNSYVPDNEPISTSNGLSIEFQDIGYGDTYRASSGRFWAYFKFFNGTPVGKSISFSSVYSHTFSNSSINGFSVGPYSFGLSWTTSGIHWEKTNFSSRTF